MLKVGDCVESKIGKGVRYEIQKIYESHTKGYYWVVAERIHWNRGYWTTFGRPKAIGILKSRSEDNLIGYKKIGRLR